MSVRVTVSPSVLRWAEARGGVDPDVLRERFPKLDAWRAGDASPTFRQLEQLAKATRTPVGLLLLDEPPVDELNIRDFRTMRPGDLPAPSPDLLDTIADCQRRQDWYRRYLVEEGHEPLPYVGSVTTGTDPVVVAANMHDELAFGMNDRRGTWSDALLTLIESAEEAGVLVMVSGVVGSNTKRKLDPREFRGFALIDDYAPVVFINGSDTKAAQIFTLAHELAHVWLGEGGVDNVDLATRNTDSIERWCNTVAAEFLVPTDQFGIAHDVTPDDLTGELERLARIYKVSTLVILRRLTDVGVLSWSDYQAAYDTELARVLDLAAGGSGGNWLNTQPRRVGKPFARAVLERTMAGSTTYGESFRLLGTRNPETIRKLARQLGVAS
jgi:Zn-dependent peptidase ImmA (M78 family)